MKIYCKLFVIAITASLLTGCGASKDALTNSSNDSDDSNTETIEKRYEDYNDSLYNRIEPIITLLIDNPTEIDSFLEDLVFQPLKEQKKVLSRKTDENWQEHFRTESKRGVFTKKKHSIKLKQPQGEIKKAFAEGLQLVIPFGLKKAKSYVIDTVAIHPELSLRKDELFDSIYVKVLEDKERASIMKFVEIEKAYAKNESYPNAAQDVTYAGLPAHMVPGKGNDSKDQSNRSGAPQEEESTTTNEKDVSQQGGTTTTSRKDGYYLSRARKYWKSSHNKTKQTVTNESNAKLAKEYALKAIEKGESEREACKILSEYYEIIYYKLKDSNSSSTEEAKNEWQKYKDCYESS